MTKEEKQLLLIDLCARLPYGVKCNALLMQINGSLKSVFGAFKGYNGWVNVGNNNLVNIETVRPYLRSIHKLTKEELEELEFLTDSDYVDYCNEHHIDYRNLIPKGLALEAPEEMYEI